MRCLPFLLLSACATSPSSEEDSSRVPVTTTSSSESVSLVDVEEPCSTSPEGFDVPGASSSVCSVEQWDGFAHRSIEDASRREGDTFFVSCDGGGVSVLVRCIGPG